jgi:hypothetical protein
MTKKRRKRTLERSNKTLSTNSRLEKRRRMRKEKERHGARRKLSDHLRVTSTPSFGFCDMPWTHCVACTYLA